MGDAWHVFQAIWHNGTHSSAARGTLLRICLAITPSAFYWLGANVSGADFAWPLPLASIQKQMSEIRTRCMWSPEDRNSAQHPPCEPEQRSSALRTSCHCASVEEGQGNQRHLRARARDGPELVSWRWTRSGWKILRSRHQTRCFSFLYHNVCMQSLYLYIYTISIPVSCKVMHVWYRKATYRIPMYCDRVEILAAYSHWIVTTK